MENEGAIAVTVSTYYIAPDKFAVKLLSVIARADGTPVWRVISQPRKYAFFAHAETYAKSYAARNGIPYIEDVRHGERITRLQEERLKKYGFSIESILKERKGTQ